MTHGYMFDHYIMPRLRAGRMDDWDNDSFVGGENIAVTNDMDVCRLFCENDQECLQYSVREGHCYWEAYDRSEEWLACGPRGEDEGRDTGVLRKGLRRVSFVTKL
jgi:hypothetical protein